jgi:hypothetical protein
MRSSSTRMVSDVRCRRRNPASAFRELPPRLSFYFLVEGSIQRLTFWNGNLMTQKKAQLQERLRKLLIERNSISKEIQRKRRQLRAVLISQTDSTSARRCLKVIHEKDRGVASPSRLRRNAHLS